MENSDYFVKKDLTEPQISQLIEYSQTDEDVKKYTHDAVRFKDRAGFDEFSTHVLSYYALTDSDDNLLGIIWFDDFHVKELTEDYGISFAIRLYADARGKGLAHEFSEEALKDFKTTDQYKNAENKKMWLTVSPDNYPAIKLYEKLGYQKQEYLEKWNKDLMVEQD